MINKEEKHEKEFAIHYLKVLLKDGGFFQPEIRKALEYAIKRLK